MKVGYFDLSPVVDSTGFRCASPWRKVADHDFQDVIEVPHGQQYAIQLSSFNVNLAANVELSIDGNEIGCYRVPAGGKIVLETYQGSDRRFTFFAANSAEGHQAGSFGIGKNDQGLITAVFHHGYVDEPVQPLYKGLNPDQLFGTQSQEVYRGGSKGIEAGVTGMTGHSNQRFTNAAPIRLTGETTTINVRLVASRTVEPIRSIEPIVARSWSNRVPPPVA